MTYRYMVALFIFRYISFNFAKLALYLLYVVIFMSGFETQVNCNHVFVLRELKARYFRGY